MTPLILVILAAMWAAVLLPPYLRDRKESPTGGSSNSVRTRIDALTSSFSGGRSYLPVSASGQTASQVPLPHGARQPVGSPQPGAEPAERMPQSSAVQILGPNDRNPQRSDATVAQLRPAGSTAAAGAGVMVTATPELTGQDTVEKRSGSSYARKRRRDVLHTLMGIAGITLVATVALGGPMLYVQLLADAALIAYVYLLVRRRKATAEREIKVAFLPHGGNGASATALLEEGGGWNPGSPVDNIRVLRAEAN